MLDHVDSPYIRCIGFLYLRYGSEPSGLWKWFEPYLYDEESVRISPSGSKPEITVGEFARGLLTDMNYHGTVLPRLPVAMEREIKVKLLQAEQIEDRAKKHLEDIDTMKHFLKIGNRIRALYGDEENPTTWYDAVVDRVVSRDDNGYELSRPKFWVTFPEYGNTELVTLGEVDVISARGNHHDAFDGRGRYDRFDSAGTRFGRGHEKANESTSRNRGYAARSDSGHHGKYGPPRDGNFKRDQPWSRGEDRHSRNVQDSRRPERNRYDEMPRNDNSLSRPASGEADLMEEVLRREREKSAAKGKAYASRPATFKESLALSDSGSDPRKKRHSSRSPIREETNSKRGKFSAERDDGKTGAATASSLVRERTLEELAAIEEKKRKLLARYG